MVGGSEGAFHFLRFAQAGVIQRKAQLGLRERGIAALRLVERDPGIFPAPRHHIGEAERGPRLRRIGLELLSLGERVDHCGQHLHRRLEIREQLTVGIAASDIGVEE